MSTIIITDLPYSVKSMTEYEQLVAQAGQTAIVAAERDAAVAQVTELTAERDAALAALAPITAERDALQARLDAAKVQAAESVVEAQQVKDALG
jgi:hypothetical protein